MPKEKAIVTRICENLKRLGIFYEKTCGSPYERRGRPDLMVIMPHTIGSFVRAPDGLVRLAFLEVKRPGCKPTPLQAHRIEQLRATGAIATVVTSWEEARNVLGL